MGVADDASQVEVLNDVVVTNKDLSKRCNPPPEMKL